MSTTGERFERAVQIMARLRAPGGCPWDREQTFDTIKPYTLEETYEVLEAIDNQIGTIRASGSDHGAAAGTRRMPVGPRTDLRHHQALHAGRDLRSPRSHRQSDRNDSSERFRSWRGCGHPADARGTANRPSTPSSPTRWKRLTKSSKPSTI